MTEHQNIEYKSSWRDEYLKWICGFANAQGGKIFIGTDDKGHVIGLADHKKLMDDIPNKAVNYLGLVVDVPDDSLVYVFARSSASLTSPSMNLVRAFSSAVPFHMMERSRRAWIRAMAAS